MASEPVFLYVEDDPTSREVMEMLLNYGLGYTQLILFSDSHNFIERLEALPQKPDVFFLDIQVPPYDGFAMLNMLRSHPNYRDATVIAVTASVMNEEIEMLKTAGFDGGIAKPIGQRDFPDVIRRILNGENVWYVA